LRLVVGSHRVLEDDSEVQKRLGEPIAGPMLRKALDDDTRAYAYASWQYFDTIVGIHRDAQRKEAEATERLRSLRRRYLNGDSIDTRLSLRVIDMRNRPELAVINVHMPKYRPLLDRSSASTTLRVPQLDLAGISASKRVIVLTLIVEPRERSALELQPYAFATASPSGRYLPNGCSMGSYFHSGLQREITELWRVVSDAAIDAQSVSYYIPQDRTPKLGVNWQLMQYSVEADLKDFQGEAAVTGVSFFLGVLAFEKESPMEYRIDLTK